MNTKSRFNKPLNYPPPTPDEMRRSASRLINSRIHGHLNGVERRELARASSDPVLREAARILDEHDPIARPLSVTQAEASRQAGQPLQTPVSQPLASVSPAARPLMQPSALRREINGRYLPEKSVQKFAAIRRFLRDLRESGKDGVA